LTGDNTYKGGTTITGGTLQIVDGGTTGSINGAPESLTSFYEISFSDANIQRFTLENRIDEIRAGSGSLNSPATGGGTVGLQKSSGDGKTSKNPVEPVLQPVVQPAFGLWASGFGDFVHVDSDYNARATDSPRAALMSASITDAQCGSPPFG